MLVSPHGYTLFDRRVALVIGAPSNDQKTKMGTGRRFEDDFRIEFSVKRSTRREPNAAQIRLFNPCDESIGLIESSGAIVQLFAGYGEPSLIFTGSIRNKKGVVVEHTPTERIVTIEAGDGEHAYQAVRFDRHYAAGTPNNTILREILGRMGLGLGPGSAALPEHTYPNDVSFYGPASRALREVVEDAGATYSVQDGNALILVGDESTAESAVLISASTGMVGSPEKGEKGKISFSSLLNPGIRPGRIVSIDSRRVQGWHTVTSLSHAGDNQAGDFRTEAECKPRGGG